MSAEVGARADFPPARPARRVMSFAARPASKPSVKRAQISRSDASPIAEPPLLRSKRTRSVAAGVVIDQVATLLASDHPALWRRLEAEGLTLHAGLRLPPQYASRPLDRAP